MQTHKTDLYKLLLLRKPSLKYDISFFILLITKFSQVIFSTYSWWVWVTDLIFDLVIYFKKLSENMQLWINDFDLHTREEHKELIWQKKKQKSRCEHHIYSTE